MAYPHVGILLSSENNVQLIHSIRWIHLETIMLSERNHTQKSNYYVIPFIWQPEKSKSIGLRSNFDIN